MKKYFLGLLVAVPFLLFAADKYSEQMSKHIAAMYVAETPEQFQQTINAFERIGNAEKSKWEPFYYASFGYIMMANGEKDLAKKDALLSQAKAALEMASAIRQDDSEIVALEGFITMIGLTVDPATRGPQYSMLAVQSFSKAIALDPKNPRALALMAQMQFGTAQFFKQEPVEACATARKALEMFNSTAGPTDPLAPAWGKSMTEGLVMNCNK